MLHLIIENQLKICLKLKIRHLFKTISQISWDLIRLNPQLIDEDQRQELIRLKSKETNLHNEREAEKNDLEERKFRENVDRINEHNANMVK